MGAPSTRLPDTKGNSQEPTRNLEVSERKILLAFLLYFFLRPLGILRFYVGKKGRITARILTFEGLGIWVLIDWILTMNGSFPDSEGKPLTEWT
ncbi:MAG: hypothetical protein CMP29_00330 [Roseibacillus sp.]|nr:hypothetical protein [Roseibacillus sp.]